MSRKLESFWTRVIALLEKQNISQKQLASVTGINPSTITKGLHNFSTPSAEVAVLIAQFLDTTVEYLVTGKNSVQDDIDTLFKHKKTVKNLETFPQETQERIESMISELSLRYSVIR